MVSNLRGLYLKSGGTVAEQGTVGAGHPTPKRQHPKPFPGNLRHNWVAVKELIFNQKDKETQLLTIHTSLLSLSSEPHPDKSKSGSCL